MSKKDGFASVWDALEDDPVRVENLKLRSALMIEIAERIKDQGLTQTQAAEVLHITQPRVSAFLKGKIGVGAQILACTGPLFITCWLR